VRYVEFAAPHLGPQATLRWAEADLRDDLTVADLAHLSTRTLTGRFRADVGLTPLDRLLRTRIRRAQELLERTDRPVDLIAADRGSGRP
jgi:transcriptional regulator GlxA family with amidase domain